MTHTKSDYDKLAPLRPINTSIELSWQIRSNCTSGLFVAIVAAEAVAACMRIVFKTCQHKPLSIEIEIVEMLSEVPRHSKRLAFSSCGEETFARIIIHL